MNYDFIEAVLARPQMYTLLGSYAEVVAFLEGYHSSLAKSRGLAQLENWSSFCEWLAKQLDVSMSNEFRVMLERYDSDSLTTLTNFYKQFKTLSAEAS